MKKLLILIFSVSSCFGQGLDAAFDMDGKVTTPIVAGLNSIYDIALQPDGKIIAVGFALTGVNYDIAIARYNSNGSIDSSFNLVGFDVVDLGFNTDVAYGAAIQSDGKIVVSGSASNVSNTDFVILRYNTDGSLDNSFDTDGIVITAFDVSYETAYDVAIQSDGKIVAAGSAFIDTAYNFAVARYNMDGSLDASFGSGGMVTTLLTNGGEAKAMVIQSDGKIVLGGSSLQPDFSYTFGVVRYNTNGSLDNTFDTDGKVITSVSPNNDFGQALALQADGKIIMAGKATPVGPEQFALVRYNTDGSLDLGWNGTGMLTTAFGTTWDEARAVIVQPDGKVIAGGLATVSGQKFAMACYNTNGTLDAGFGTGGKVTTSFGSSSSIWALAWQPDSKILAAGYSGSASNYDFALARYKASSEGSGVMDFGILDNSVVAYPNPFSNQITLAYNLQNSEKITIQLVDMHGKVQETYMASQLQQAGKYQQNFLVPEGLPEATYFIVIYSPNGQAGIKIIHQ